jgi:hypothetical protein
VLVLSTVSPRNRPRAFVFAHTTPGWQWRLTAPLRTETVFAKDSPHQVIAPNKVIELKKNSVILEKKFERKYELPFFVSPVHVQAYQSILSLWSDRSNVRVAQR